MKIIRYEHPMGGGGSTDAVTDAGRYNVSVQYASVLPCGDAPEVSAVDAAMLLDDAKVNGKFGPAPRPVETAEAKAEREAGLAEYERSHARIVRAMAE